MFVFHVKDDMMTFKFDLNIFSKWFSYNSLDLNINKCKSVWYYRQLPENLCEIRDLSEFVRYIICLLFVVCESMF